MTRTPAKAKKQQLNRLARNRQRRNLAICTALGTAITFVISNIPLECSTVDLEFDYPKVKIDFEFRLNLEDVRYCETALEKKNRVEERNIEE